MDEAAHRVARDAQADDTSVSPFYHCSSFQAETATLVLLGQVGVKTTAPEIQMSAQ